MNNNNRSTGLDLSVILTVIFVTLKLCNLINWSWLWVLSPLWIGALLTIILFIIVYIISRF